MATADLFAIYYRVFKLNIAYKFQYAHEVTLKDKVLIHVAQLHEMS